MKKHIDTFKNFLTIYENWNDNDYFKIVEHNNDIQKWINRMIDVTNEDLKVVTSCLDSGLFGIIKKYDIKISIFGLLNNDNDDVKNHKYIIAKRKEFAYNILRLSDEWFLVKMSDSDSNLYYLCDQIEGLKHFLKKSTK
jgi:hypothetical protein